MTTRAHAAIDAGRSVFAGADICHIAGLALSSGARRPEFEHDVWDFSDVIGLPTQMHPHKRRFNFTAIANHQWRLVGKELIGALLAPRHEAVASLPRARRTPLRLSTAFDRLSELVRFLNWLTDHGITSLDRVDHHRCAAYLAHRSNARDDNDVVIGERSPATRRAAAQVVVDLANYRDLFTPDRLPAGLVPWDGATPSAIAGRPAGVAHTKSAPVDNTVLQPMLAAATYLVTSLGPHTVELSHQLQEAQRRRSDRTAQYARANRDPAAEIEAVLTDYERRGESLPLLPEHNITRRITAGWNTDDPLTPIALDVLAHHAGSAQFLRRWLPALRPRIEATLRLVGAEKPLGRRAEPVDRADGAGTVAWTPPLDQHEGDALVRILRTAAVIVLAAITGMRSSELMELQIGCCRPPEQFGAGLMRYRLTSKVIKGQPLGGTDDEWVVIETAYRAAQLLEDLHDHRAAGASLLGRFAFDVRYRWFRKWVNGPAGHRLGLAPIPNHPVSLRALRRTLAIELAYRPGGLIAAKVHLRHISVVTTEGFASRPGGAQAELLAEVRKHESDRNLDLVLAEFRNYQQGIMPAGPGARELIELFAHVDTKIGSLAPGPAKIQISDHDVLGLLTKRADTLHLAPANYCWFTDPSRALCLKLAETPHADKPLTGMCDSARCPQATHHPCHRPVWAEHAQQTATFLGGLGRTRKTEHARLQGDYDRAQRVLSAIDAEH